MEYHDYTDMDLVDFDNDWGGITFTSGVNTESIDNLEIDGVLNGLERVLTIIARYRLFEIYKYSEFENRSVSSLGLTQSETIDIVKSELKDWFGFSESASSFESKDWFKYYYDNYSDYPVSINDKGTGAKLPYVKNIGKPIRLKPEIFMPTNRPSKGYLVNVPTILRSDAKLIIPWDQLANKKARNFEKQLFTNKPGDKNTFKALSYEKAIASAINLGKLNIFYLIANDSFIRDLKVQKTDRNKKTRITPVDIKTDCKRIDYLLKYIGVYLIEKRYTQKQCDIIFNVTAFSLWTSNDLSKHEDRFTDSKGSEIVIKGNDTSKGKSGSSVRITNINSSFLKRHGFRIIEKEEIIKESLNNGTLSSNDITDYSEDDLIKMYLKIINADTTSNSPRYSLYSDNGFGELLTKHTPG